MNVTKRKLTIGLDFDNTYSSDPGCFRAIIRCFQSMGHEVICVTMRHHEIDWLEEFKILEDKYNVPTVFCDGHAKRKVTQDLGIGIDIWIDDWPEGIAVDSIYTPIQLLEWRKEQEKINKLNVA